MREEFSSPEIDLFLRHLKKEEMNPPEEVLENYWERLLRKIECEKVRIRRAIIIRRLSYEFAAGLTMIILFLWTVHWLNFKYPVLTYIKLAGQLW